MTFFGDTTVPTVSSAISSSAGYSLSPDSSEADSLEKAQKTLKLVQNKFKDNENVLSVSSN